jgi:hypothetical protein
MSFSTCSAGAGPDFCFIFAACGYDEDPQLVSKVPTRNSLGSIGVVYGDIATSPPYALKEDLS